MTTLDDLGHAAVPASAGAWHRPNRLIALAVLGGVGLTVVLAHAYIPWQWLMPDLWVIAAFAIVTLLATLAFWRAQIPPALIKLEIAPEQASRWLMALLGIGIALRLGWVIAVPPIQESDAFAYWHAAIRLIEEGTHYYFVEGGHKVMAWRPPGVPLALAPAVALFGPQDWVPAMVNLLAYIVTSVILFDAGRRLMGDSAAVVAVGLLALDPGAIAAIGLALSELLSLMFFLGSFWAVVRSRERPWAFGLLAGVLLGCGALFKPAYLLMPVVWLVFLALVSPDIRTVGRRFAPMVLAFVLTMTPWATRNYLVLDAFVPVSTNGGDVFYRANNPLASGTYMVRGERDIRAEFRHDEAQWNSIGYKLGLEWILENPVDFLKLAFHKQSYFLAGGSATFIYYTLERGHGSTGLTYQMLYGYAQIWWIALWIMIGAGLLRNWRMMIGSPGLVFMLLVFLYLVAMHSVFESQPRHLIPCYGFLLLIAASAVTTPRPR